MNLRILSEAEDEIEEARKYLNRHFRGLGRRFLDDLAARLATIAADPLRLPKLKTQTDVRKQDRLIRGMRLSDRTIRVEWKDDLDIVYLEACAMNIELSPDQQAFLVGLVTAGRFRSVGEAIRESVDLLISREDLKQQVQVGIDQADRGDVIDHDTLFQHLRTLASAADESARQ